MTSPDDPREPERPAAEPDDGLDHAALDELRALAAGTEAFADLLGTFVAELPSLVSSLREARARGDHQALARGAHKLKGGAAILGARALSAAAEALEASALGPGRGGLHASLERVAREVERAIASLGAASLTS